MDATKILENAVADGLREGVKARLANQYSNSPLDKLITETLADSVPAFRKLLEEAISSCTQDEEFRQQVKSSVRQQIAKTLIQRFGGEVEKQVNALKSDPTTRARITLAIEELVKAPH